MEDQKRNPVYFECDKVLSEEQKRRITNYFQIKRRSGGGECSPVEEVSGNIYRTVFTHREDQQSVLQRTEHVVQLTEGRLTLTVRESLEPQTSEHTSSSSSSSSSSSTSSTQSVQSQQSNSTAEDVEDRSSLRDSLDSGNSIFTTNSRPSGEEIQMDTAAQIPPEQSSGGGRVHVEIIQGTIEDQQVFRSAQEELHQNQVQESKRIVLLGKTGSGKSSLGNTILGEKLFITYHTSCSGTGTCQCETRDVNGRKISMIDTPGLFDTEKSEEALRPEIMRCVTDFAPGIHAFLIVLKVERYSEHEQAVISRIREYFSEDALRFAVVIFTHGDDLHEGMEIEEFVSLNKKLSDLVKSCGGRCHVFDNRRWNNNTQQNDYRSNHFQREELLKTIDKLTEERNGECYTNEMLQAVEEEIQREEENIRKSSTENLSAEEIRDQAKNKVSNRLLIDMAGITTGVVLGALFGVEVMLVKAVKRIRNVVSGAPSAGEASAAAGAAVAVMSPEVAFVVGGVIGGRVGFEAAQEAETVQDAVTKVTKALKEVKRKYM